jgi:hypothetical protein
MLSNRQTKNLLAFQLLRPTQTTNSASLKTYGMAVMEQRAVIQLLDFLICWMSPVGRTETANVRLNLNYYLKQPDQVQSFTPNVRGLLTVR